MQDVLVYLIVLAAVAYLVRLWWPSKKRDAGCSGCSSGGCASTRRSTPDVQNTAASNGLIQIEVKKSPRENGNSNGHFR